MFMLVNQETYTTYSLERSGTAGMYCFATYDVLLPSWMPLQKECAV